MKRNYRIISTFILASALVIGSFGTAKSALADGKYTPGTYSATDEGFGGDVTVTITVDENSITDVKIDAPD